MKQKIREGPNQGLDVRVPMTSKQLRGQMETKPFLLKYHTIVSTEEILGHEKQQRITINWDYAIIAIIFVEFLLSEIALPASLVFVL